MDEFNDSNSICQSDFRTPCQKAVPGNYVVKRSNYSRLIECSPLPDPLNNVVDEDMWFQMNKGYIADLDSIHITPARKVQSFPPANETPVSYFHSFIFTQIFILRNPSAIWAMTFLTYFALEKLSITFAFAHLLF